MFLQGLKYIGNKEVGVLLVLTLPPTHPARKQIFQKEEVKLLGREIDDETAKYLASEYKGVVKFVEVEVDATILLKDSFDEVKEMFDGELSPEDSLLVFCEVFGVDLVNDLQKKNAELEKALKELTALKADEVEEPVEEESAEVKEPAKKKAPAKKKKASMKRKRSASKAE